MSTEQSSGLELNYRDGPGFNGICLEVHLAADRKVFAGCHRNGWWVSLYEHHKGTGRGAGETLGEALAVAGVPELLGLLR